LRLLTSHHSSPTATSTLSLHDALPISHLGLQAAHDVDRPLCVALADGELHVGGVGGARMALDDHVHVDVGIGQGAEDAGRHPRIDRKSTRLNSSHSQISYAVFCLKKKK